MSIIHNDIKLDNIMLDEELHSFSFGVLMLQLIMRKIRPVSENPFTLSTIKDWARDEHAKRRHAVVKELLLDGCSKSNARSITEVAIRCTGDLKTRQRIEHIVQALETLEYAGPCGGGLLSCVPCISQARIR
ncbi:hypothetical protein CCACVL1_29008 [Corchorus capsularis]|uniref:Protein kinase domain-containing protein n=1 Tax=Corchorus capsularis TaxID=210143 RepID=A0A1R3G4C2_COCAP|nr:hypothetical protein CCACVL1_29008 [Corchorus capsularis]